MLRIEDKFKELKEAGKKAFIAYIPFGFPNISLTKDIILTLQDSGVDIIELGLPFSDPIADGPIIQAATFHALNSGANTENLFVILEEIKNNLKVPIVIMSYYNPIFRFGIKSFFEKMKNVNVNGIMIVDLPVEESEEYIKISKVFDFETIFFVTPVTSAERTKKIIKAGKGFIYYISVTGITGPKKLPFNSLVSHINELRKFSDLPICIGFGIHTRDQVKKINQFSDGVIVGSGIVKFIEENFQQDNFLNKLKDYVSSLRG